VTSTFELLTLTSDHWYSSSTDRPWKFSKIPTSGL